MAISSGVERLATVPGFNCSSEDIEFRRQFEACEYPLTDFDHRAHLRLAYIYLAGSDIDNAAALMKSGLQNYLRHHEIDPLKYHETLTRSWVLAVNYFMQKTGKALSANDLIEWNPEMLDKDIMLTHYSAELFFSDAAREQFLAPDLSAIPDQP